MRVCESVFIFGRKKAVRCGAVRCGAVRALSPYSRSSGYLACYRACLLFSRADETTFTLHGMCPAASFSVPPPPTMLRDPRC